jgi:hypothetical protein
MADTGDYPSQGTIIATITRLEVGVEYDVFNGLQTYPMAQRKEGKIVYLKTYEGEELCGLQATRCKSGEVTYVQLHEKPYVVCAQHFVRDGRGTKRKPAAQGGAAAGPKQPRAVNNDA